MPANVHTTKYPAISDMTTSQKKSREREAPGSLRND